MRSPLAIALCLLLLTGATCEGTRLPPQVDLAGHGLDGLSPIAQEELQRAARTMSCFCGCGHPLAECLASHQTCRHAPRMLRLAGALARAGATSTEILEAAGRHYRTFAAPAASIPIEPGGCRGPDEAAVTIVLFSDFECPACSTTRFLLAGIPEASGRVRLCYRHFPLKVHPQALPAAQAAEYARTQGKFWEMHDALFDHQDALGTADLIRHGKGIGLDESGLASSLSSQQFLNAVIASKENGKTLGVDGTPTLFLNGRPFTLPLDGSFLVLAIEDAAEWGMQGPWTQD